MQSERESARSLLPLVGALLLPLPWIALSTLGGHASPLFVAALTGAAIFGAAFLLSWAAELVQLDLSQAFALALLAFIAFLAGLVPVIWRAGQETLAVAVAISGGLFVAMGLVSNAAETALIGVADANQPAAVVALDQLQGRTPIVWTITALVAALSLGIGRAGLVRRWLAVAGLVAAAVFLLGSVFSVLGRTPEGGSSLVGVGLFIAWMLALSAALWRTAARGGL